MLISIGKEGLYLWLTKQSTDPVAIIKQETAFIEKTYKDNKEILRITELAQKAYDVIQSISVADLRIIQETLALFGDVEFLEEPEYA